MKTLFQQGVWNGVANGVATVNGLASAPFSKQAEKGQRIARQVLEDSYYEGDW